MNWVAPGWCPVTSGVQQGSTLGPALFNLFTNHLDTQDKLKAVNWDTKLGGAVESRDSAERSQLISGLDNHQSYEV